MTIILYPKKREKKLNSTYIKAIVYHSRVYFKSESSLFQVIQQKFLGEKAKEKIRDTRVF